MIGPVCRFSCTAIAKIYIVLRKIAWAIVVNPKILGSFVAIHCTLCAGTSCGLFDVNLDAHVWHSRIVQGHTVPVRGIAGESVKLFNPYGFSSPRRQIRYKADMHRAILGSRDILVTLGVDVPGLTAGRIKRSCSRPTHAVPTTAAATIQRKHRGLAHIA